MSLLSAASCARRGEPIKVAFDRDFDFTVEEGGEEAGPAEEGEDEDGLNDGKRSFGGPASVGEKSGCSGGRVDGSTKPAGGGTGL